MAEATAVGSDVAARLVGSAPGPSDDGSAASSCQEDTIAARGGILGADCCAGDD